MENRKQQSLVTSATHPNCSDLWNWNVLDSHWVWYQILDTYVNANFWDWNTIGSYWLCYKVS